MSCTKRLEAEEDEVVEKSEEVAGDIRDIQREDTV
jgi:hypothetical protein